MTSKSPIPNWLQIGTEIWKLRAKFIDVITYSMTVTATILAKFLHDRQFLFVNKFCTEFHENPVKRLVADTRSENIGQTDEHRDAYGLYIKRCFFTLYIKRKPTNKVK